MIYKIILPSYLSDAVISTPAIRAFKESTKKTDKVIISVVDTLFDVFEFFEYTDKITMIPAESYSKATKRFDEGRWIKDGQFCTIVLSPGVAQQICNAVPAVERPGHLMHGYAGQLGKVIKHPWYQIKIGTATKLDTQALLKDLAEERPVLLFAPYPNGSSKSNKFSSSKDNTVPIELWEDVRKHFEEKYFCLFVSDDSKPQPPGVGGDWEVGSSLALVASAAFQAKAVVSLTNGILQLAASQNANILHIFQDNISRLSVEPSTAGKLLCLENKSNEEAAPITSEEIIKSIEELLAGIEKD